MLADGLIERIDEPVTSKRKTNRYRITDAGRGVLIQWLTTPVMQKPVRNELLLKIMFSAAVSAEETIAHLQQSLQQREQTLSQLMKVKPQLELMKNKPREWPYWMITLDYGLMFHQTAIEWLKQSINRLKK